MLIKFTRYSGHTTAERFWGDGPETTWTKVLDAYKLTADALDRYRNAVDACAHAGCLLCRDALEKQP